MTNTNGAPINTKLPDPPKAIEWVRNLSGLVPFALVLGLVIASSLMLPRWLRGMATADLRGVPEQTSTGIVRQLLDDPGQPGGGGVFNSVVIEFNRHKVYWDLPPTSKWRPMIGELVEVRYRVGRTGSHVAHIDSVQWGTAMDPGYKQP